MTALETILAPAPIRTYATDQLTNLDDAIRYCIPDATPDTAATLRLMSDMIHKELRRREAVGRRMM